jgi:hypothetical protein
MPSAKHPFQLLKTQNINGKRFVYNIDLLHPHMLDNPDQIGMFVDHMELDVPLNNHEVRLKEMKSIVLPNSEIRIEESLTNFKKHLKKKPEEFNKNVMRFSNKVKGSPAKDILGALNA